MIEMLLPCHIGVHISFRIAIVPKRLTKIYRCVKSGHQPTQRTIQQLFDVVSE